MAYNITCSTASGLTLYFVVLNESNQVWNGSSFETENDAHWSEYANPLFETMTGVYEGTFPTGISRGIYSILAYKQSDGSPNPSDRALMIGGMDWNGVAENSCGESSNESEFVVSVGDQLTVNISPGVKDSGDNSGIGIVTGVK